MATVSQLLLEDSVIQPEKKSGQTKHSWRSQMTEIATKL